MYRHILLTVVLTAESSWAEALPTAVEYARAFGSTLHLMTVVPDFGMTVVGQFFPEDFARKAVDQARRDLEALAARAIPADLDVHHEVAYGTIYEQILKTARAVDADLIVMASHRPELKDYLIGPNAARVVRHADRSVLVVRN
jgi:nucleotide-binding universal stress UspA family protein